jgi:hypothetical protein
MDFVSETYISLGPACTWIYCGFGLVCFLIALVPLLFIGKSTRTTGLFTFLGFLYLIAGITQMPVALLFACMFLVMPASAVFSRKNGMPAFARVILFAISVGVGCLAVFMLADSRIMLNDKALVMRPTGLNSSSRYRFDWADFPRQDIEIHASLFPRKRLIDWVSYPESYSWDIYHGDTHGPHFPGNDFYWGPHGLTRGDTVGKRIAHWAGVTPSYRVYRYGPDSTVKCGAGKSQREIARLPVAFQSS